MTKKQLLTEGGMGAGGKGHMDHPYDNTDLTFSQIKNMFKVASQGFPKVKVTEKLDGQNILISYDTITQEAIAVRNKTQAKSGGITKNQLIAAMTTDRPVEKRVPQNVVDAFRESMENFARVAATAPGEFFITPEGGKIFYNAEVIDPRSVNVVDYDAQTLIIHRTGHILSIHGRVENLDSVKAEGNAAQLEEILSDIQTDSIPIVKVNAVRNFTDFLEKKDAYRRIIANIDSTIRDVGLSDSNTIEDFLTERVKIRISRTMPGTRLSEEALGKFVEAVVYYGKTSSMPRKRTEIANTLSEIPEHFQNERNIVLTTLSDRKALKDLAKAAARPLEMIVHKFAVEILENFKSAYIIQSDVAVQKLQKKVGKKIKDIRAGANEDDLTALKVGIRKLLNAEDDEDVLSDESIQSAIEKISTVVEGLVFDFEGRTYKFTGNFAPINQIMGLGRYSRGKRDDSVLEEEEEIVDSEEEVEMLNSQRKIAVFPGKFKPPHRGHLHLVKEVLNKGVDIVVIMVSPLTKNDITAENSIDVWKLYISQSGINPEKVLIMRSPYNSPVMSSYAIMDEPIPELKKNNIPQEGDLIIPVASTKPDDKGVSDIQRFEKYHLYQPKLPGITPADVSRWAVDPDADCEGAYCASDFRKALDASQDIVRYVPPEVDPEEVKRILGFLSEPGIGAEDPRYSLDEGLLFKLIYEVLTESDWQPVAKSRMRKSMKRLLTKGNKKAAKYGGPFSINPNIGKSNAFLAKESESSDVGSVSIDLPPEISGGMSIGTLGGDKFVVIAADGAVLNIFDSRKEAVDFIQNKKDKLEELSAMATSAVAGASASVGKTRAYDVWHSARRKKKKRNNTTN